MPCGDQFHRNQNLNAISEKLYHSMNLQVSLEEVLLGRYRISSELTRNMEERSTFETLFGSGAGAANATATIVTDGTLTLPHDDWLKVSYDYGIVGSIALTIFLARMFSANAVSASLLLTSAIIMITDNVLGYLFYQFVLALMLGCVGEFNRGVSTSALRSRWQRRQHAMGKWIKQTNRTSRFHHDLAASSDFGVIRPASSWPVR